MLLDELAGEGCSALMLLAASAPARHVRVMGVMVMKSEMREIYEVSVMVIVFRRMEE